MSLAEVIIYNVIYSCADGSDLPGSNKSPLPFRLAKSWKIRKVIAYQAAAKSRMVTVALCESNQLSSIEQQLSGIFTHPNTHSRDANGEYGSQ